MNNVNQSYWSDSVTRAKFSTLQGQEHCEIAVVGAGMVGILTAWLLQKEGKQVTLVEANRVADGVTAYTTAKITAQHSLIYQKLLKNLGKEKARTYYEANDLGSHFIKQVIDELQIDCDFEERDAVVYATTEQGKSKILKEMNAYQEIGIDGYLAYDIPDFPIEITAAIGLPGQAQFHPVKFLLAVLDDFVKRGGIVFEHSRALEVKNKNDQVILIENGAELRAKDVVLATHYPINDEKGLYFSRLSIERSYSVLGNTVKNFPRGMFINVESPTRSFRTVKGKNGEDLVMVGGDGHPVGRSNDTQEHYQNLKQFAEAAFSVDDFYYQWSTQDPTTPDKIPYIGQMHAFNKQVLVATGFNKWGMTNGAVAAMLLKDILTKQPNEFESLFKPARSHLKTSTLSTLAKENSLVAKELIKGKINPRKKVNHSLHPGQGSIVEVAGERIGIYLHEDGTEDRVSPVCTHMGCTVGWNQAEKSWDCPCHGSRFSSDGSVLEGPAVKPLNKK